MPVYSNLSKGIYSKPWIEEQMSTKIGVWWGLKVEGTGKESRKCFKSSNIFSISVTFPMVCDIEQITMNIIIPVKKYRDECHESLVYFHHTTDIAYGICMSTWTRMNRMRKSEPGSWLKHNELGSSPLGIWFQRTWSCPCAANEKLSTKENFLMQSMSTMATTSNHCI